jgi:hypothetical protein
MGIPKMQVMNLTILQAHDSHIQVLIGKLQRGKIVALE